MKYRIEKARGHYTIRHLYEMATGGSVYDIKARGTTIPRQTAHPVHDFCILYSVNRCFGVWHPHPSHVPTFTRRCAE